MDNVIFFLINHCIIIVLIIQIVHHSLLVNNWLKLERAPHSEDKFYFYFFSPILLITYYVPHHSFTQKHCGQLISHLDKSPVAPAVESAVHFLRHSRCAIRSVLRPFLLNRQIFLAGSYNQVPTLLRSWERGLRHLTLRASSRLFPLQRRSLCETTPVRWFDEPYMAFRSSKMFKAHQCIQCPNQFLKESAQWQQSWCGVTAREMWGYKDSLEPLHLKRYQFSPWLVKSSLWYHPEDFPYPTSVLWPKGLISLSCLPTTSQWLPPFA